MTQKITPQEKFRKDRKNAFDEIREVFLARMDELAKLGATLGDSGKMIMPDYLRTEETFRWPGVVLLITGDLKEEKPLKDVFARVSPRYDAATRPKLPAIAGDLAPSAAKDGRNSAFDDVFRALAIAERDFEDTYKYLSKGQLDYWRQRHPLPDAQLQLAYKENQRFARQQVLTEVRRTLEDLQNRAPSAPPWKPQGPQV
jgi:hypothetical protein